MFIYQIILHKKIRPVSLIAAEKFLFLQLYIYTFCSLTDGPTVKYLENIPG